VTMIKTVKVVSALLPASFVTLLSMTTIVAAQGDCEWYAKTAVRQQQINETLNCKFVGEAWHKDLAAHRKWCAGVPPDLWKAQAKQRSQQLSACEKR
jgi:hypothetical protein